MTEEVKKMSKVYATIPMLLSNKPKNGRYSNIPYLPGLDVKVSRTLVEARAYAYKKISRHGLELDGNIFCIIASREGDGKYKLIGAVESSPWDWNPVSGDVLYWCPSKDGIRIDANLQYRLHKDGSLGKKM